MVCVIGGLQKSGKFTCSGDTFGGCWLLFNFDDSYNTKVWSVDHIIIFIYTNGVSDIILCLLVYCCFYLHSNASSGTLLHILCTYAIFVYFVLTNFVTKLPT